MPPTKGELKALWLIWTQFKQDGMSGFNICDCFAPLSADSQHKNGC